MSHARSWLRPALIVACTLAGAVWLFFVGPIHVIRITTPLEETAPFLYMLSAFPVLGMCIADLFELYRDRGLTSPTVSLGLQILLILLISSGRLGMKLPISGHTLLVSFLIARRLLSNEAISIGSRLEVAVASGILGILTYIKLAWWTDPITLVSGCLLGFLIAALGKTVSKRARTESFPQESQPG
jgi:hypothetical protein